MNRDVLMTGPHCDSVRLRLVGPYQDTNIYELHSLQFTNRYFILSHPDSCALMGQPEVVDFMVRRSLLSQTEDAFCFLQDQGLGRNLDILTILRGGLNYPLEEACCMKNECFRIAEGDLKIKNQRPLAPSNLRGGANVQWARR